jgi:hypothetical protein
MAQKSVFIAFITLATLMVSGAVQAQNKTGCKRTVEQCLQACAKTGGQARYCPTYCADRQRNTGCP